MATVEPYTPLYVRSLPMEGFHPIFVELILSLYLVQPPSILCASPPVSFPTVQLLFLRFFYISPGLEVSRAPATPVERRRKERGLPSLTLRERRFYCILWVPP